MTNIATAGLIGDWHAAMADIFGPGHNGTPSDTSWRDLSGFGRNGVLQGFAYTTASGWAGSGTPSDPYCLVFDGSGDYVNCGDLVAGADLNFSFEAWFHATAAVTHTLIAEGLSTSGSNTYPNIALTISSAGLVSFKMVNDANASHTVTGASSVLNGAVHHLVATCDGAMMRLYVDGVSVGTPVAPSAAPYTLDRLLLGVRSSSLANYFNGALVAARVYDHALSVDEVSQNFSAGCNDVGVLPPSDDQLDWRKGLSLQVLRRGTTIKNLVPNPRFANNVEDGWSLAWSVTPNTLSATADVCAPNSTNKMPSSMTKCVKLHSNGDGNSFRVASSTDYTTDADGSLIAVNAGDSYAWSAWVKKGSQNVDMCVYWYQADGTYIGSASYVPPDSGGDFKFYSVVYKAPAGAAMVQPAFHLYGNGTGAFDAWATGAIFAPSITPFTEPDYVDGSTPGCSWQELANYSYTVDSADTMGLDGREMDLTGEAYQLRFSSRMPKGFDTLSFRLNRRIDHTYADAQRDYGVRLTQNGRTLWQGTIYSVDKFYDEGEYLVVRCRGLFDILNRKKSFRRVYKEQALMAWRTDQTNDHAGVFFQDVNKRLHLRVPRGMYVANGGSRRLYYELFDGVPAGTRIRRVSFQFAYNLGSANSNWIAELIGLDDISDLENYPNGATSQPPQASTKVIWPTSGSPQNGGSSTSWSATQDVDLVAAGKTCRAIALRLRRASSDLAAPDHMWVMMRNVTIYATPVSDTGSGNPDNISVSTVLSDIVTGVATSANVTSQSSYALDQCAFRGYHTRAEAIGNVVDYVAGFYDYAVWDDGAFVAGDRPDGTTIAIPPNSHYVVRLGQPGLAWQVAKNYDHAVDAVIVRYRKPANDCDPGRHVAEIMRPSGGGTRTAVLNCITRPEMSVVQARAVANRFLRERAAGMDCGTVLVSGTVSTIKGAQVPAFCIRAGDWIENASLPGHQPLFISKSEVNLETGEVTLHVNGGARVSNQLEWWEQPVVPSVLEHHDAPPARHQAPQPDAESLWRNLM